MELISLTKFENIVLSSGPLAGVVSADVTLEKIGAGGILDLHVSKNT